MYIPREIESKIRPFLHRREAIALIGPRQVGKTTYLKNLFSQLKKKVKKAKFITFENRQELALFNEIEDFKKLNQNSDLIIIDEFQYAKDGGKKLKYLYDTTKIKYIISGSSSFELTFQTGKYMVGRMINFSLYPFSFREYLLAKNPELTTFVSTSKKTVFGKEIERRIKEAFEQYLIWGGYPAVVLAKGDLQKRKILESIVENYLVKDIQGLLQFSSTTSLMILVKLLAGQIGNLINYQELSTLSSLSYKELLRYLEILRKTYIIDLVRPYATNRRTEIVKNPKAYFIDSGFKNFLLNDFRPINQRIDLGSLVENYVFINLKKTRGELQPVNYWRTKSKAEIDFVVEKEGSLVPIEVKYSTKPTPGKSFYSFIKKYKPAVAHILTAGEIKQIKIAQTKVIFQPVFTFY